MSPLFNRHLPAACCALALAGCNLAEKEQNLRVLVSDLLELTRQNHSRLQSTLARTRDKLDQLGEAGKNLKRLRRAYGGLPVCGLPV